MRIGDEAPRARPRRRAPLARAEGFELHARSMEARIRDNDPHDRAPRSTARPARPTFTLRSRSTATGAGERDTGVGFFDHMLDLLARHGRLDLTCRPSGDLETGAHHTVEDAGICIGQALDEALGDRAGIARFGHATVPMDEARASCAIDISGRGLCASRRDLPPGAIGNFDHELTEEFFRAVALNAKLTAAPDRARPAPTPTT